MPFDISDQSDGLKTVSNIPIAAVGENWKTSTGIETVTEEDLMCALAALDDPAIKTPRVKLGHLDPRFTPDLGPNPFDGTPVLGKFINLRYDDKSMTLYADAVGVPEWFATIMPYAYPNRSMEAYRHVETATGHTHDFVITAVALLGDELPAIETLDDLKTLFSSDGPEWAGDLVQKGEHVMASKGGVVPLAKRIAASTSIEDVRRSFFEDFATEESGRYWWWIRAAYVDPSILICSDDSDSLYAVPYTVTDSGAEFGDPSEVFTQYVETESGKIAASRVMLDKPAVAVFNKSGGSRPQQPIPKKGDQVPRINASIDVGNLRTRLGLTAEQLPDDATEEQINQALSGPVPGTGPDVAQTGNPAQPEPGSPEAGAVTNDPPAANAPPSPDLSASAAAANVVNDDLVTIDKETLRVLTEGAKQGAEMFRTATQSRRREVVEGAIKAGKIPRSRMEHYTKLMDVDEEGTSATLASLPAGLIPVGPEAGSAGDLSGEGNDVAYPDEWLSDGERQRIAAARAAANPRIVQEASN
jgi:hypothetical protein